MLEAEDDEAISQMKAATSKDKIITLVEQFTGFLPNLAFLLADNHYIRFGPHGVHPIVTFICRIMDVLTSSSTAGTRLPFDRFIKVVEDTKIYVQSLLNSVLIFRTTIARELYDPMSFRIFRIALNEKSPLLPVRINLYMTKYLLKLYII